MNNALGLFIPLFDYWCLLKAASIIDFARSADTNKVKRIWLGFLSMTVGDGLA